MFSIKNKNAFWGRGLHQLFSTIVPAIRCKSAAKLTHKSLSGLSTPIRQPSGIRNAIKQKQIKHYKWLTTSLGAFRIVSGWWRHQPGQDAVGGVSTAHRKQSNTTILNAHFFFSPHS